jgi:N-acetylglucosaminyl-diphospho-decaprenol L-rhamnosyltransferase
MNPPDLKASQPDVSVVVVTHNNESLIADCLRSIETGVRAHSHETILVDSGSRDDTIASIPDELIPTSMIVLGENTGFAAANNTGIAASRGRLIALVNSDAFPDPGSIDALIDAIDTLPAAGIVGAALRYPTGEPQPSIGRFPSLLGGLWVALYLHRLPFTARADVGVSVHPAHYRARRRVDWVTAAFCIARREAGRIPVVGFMYGEDVEWAAACGAKGFEVWYEPAATAVHIGRASVDQSQDGGFAQRQRAQFELSWFARRGRLVELAARAVLILHAVSRIAAFGATARLGRSREPRAAEFKALLRAALARRPPDL